MYFTVKMYFRNFDESRSGVAIATRLKAANVAEAVQEGYVTLTAFVPYYHEDTISMDIIRTDEYENPIENVSMEEPINCWLSNEQVKGITRTNDKWREPQPNTRIEIHIHQSNDDIKMYQKGER